MLEQANIYNIGMELKHSRQKIEFVDIRSISTIQELDDNVNLNETGDKELISNMVNTNRPIISNLPKDVDYLIKLKDEEIDSDQSEAYRNKLKEAIRSARGVKVRTKLINRLNERNGKKKSKELSMINHRQQFGNKKKKEVSSQEKKNTKTISLAPFEIDIVNLDFRQNSNIDNAYLACKTIYNNLHDIEYKEAISLLLENLNKNIEYNPLCYNVKNLLLLDIRNIPAIYKNSRFLKIDGTKLSIIPMYLRGNNSITCNERWLFKDSNNLNKIYISDAYDADWIWLDIMENITLTGSFNFVIGCKVMSMLCVPHRLGTLRYVNIEEKLINLDNNVKYLIYRHLLGRFDNEYAAPVSWLNLYKTNNRFRTTIKENRDLVKLLKYYNNCKVPEFFREDQVFVHDEILLSLSDQLNDQTIYDLINIRNTISRLLIYGLIIYLHSIPKIYVIIIKLSGLLDVNDDYEFIELGKQLSDKAKSLHHISDLDMRPLFEIHNLVNRTITPIDWKKEYINRTQPNLANIPTDYVFKKASEIFTEGRLLNEGYFNYKTRSWTRFWSERLEWGTTGAFFSAYQEDISHINKYHKDFRNKMYYFLSKSNNITLDYFMTREPKIEASVSIKYEWAKQRAIYGTDVTNYVMTQFVMQNCEELLTRDLAIGRNSNMDVVKNKINYVMRGKTPFCLDFEDFNSQHSAENMCAVIRAYINVWWDKMSIEQRVASRWLVQSMFKQIVHDSLGLKIMYQTVGTLLSGWRLTSFVNTILNKVYYTYLQGGLQIKYHSIHSGDDILVGISTLKEVQIIYRRCKKYNVRLSPLKCFVGSVAEFLRVDHKERGSGQYLPRGIATLVAGKIESSPAYDIRDIMNAIIDRGNEVKARGMPIHLANAIIKAQSIYQCKRLKIDFSLGLELLNTNRQLGGLSDYAPLRPYRYKLEIKTEEMDFDEFKTLSIVQPGVYIYVYNCLKWLPSLGDKVDIYSQYVQDKITKSMLKVPNRLIKEELTKEELNYEKCLAGHKHSFKHLMEEIHEYGKIRLIGQTVQMFKTIRKDHKLGFLVATAKHPLRVLTVATTNI